jgi:hypothetical protein
MKRRRRYFKFAVTEQFLSQLPDNKVNIFVIRIRAVSVHPEIHFIICPSHQDLVRMKRPTRGLSS